MNETLEYTCVHDASAGVGAELAQTLHLRFPEAYRSANSMAEIAASIRKREDSPFCILPFCHTVEGEALGGHVNLGDAKIGPRASDYICERAEDILALDEVDYTNGRIGAVLAACKVLASRGETVCLNVSGPFTILNILMDAMNIFRMLRKEPVLAGQVLDKIREQQLCYLYQAKEAGVKVISYGDSAGAYNIVGPKLAAEIAEQFTQPFLKEAVERIGKDMLIMLCPKTTFALLETKKACWEQVKLPKVMEYGVSCQWAIGRINLVGETCVKNLHLPLKDGYLKSLQLL